MKRINKKGFTIVELVIVIAVIAILAGVLIPTFTGLIRKANVSSDTQLVRNLNTALTTDAALNGKHETMQDVLDGVSEYGFDLAKIMNTKVTENTVLWDSENDIFCYLNNGEVTYIPNSTDGTLLPANDYRLWKIYASAEKELVEGTSEKYSAYLTGEGWGESITVVDKGLDVGKVTGITSVNYNSDSSNKVIIRTNGEKLVVNAGSGTVKHYGESQNINIIAIAPNSYHEFGKAGYVEIASGRFVVEENAKVIALVSTSESTVVETKDNGTINKTFTSEEYQALTDTEKADLKYDAEAQIVNAIKVNTNYYKSLSDVFEKCPNDNGNGYNLTGENTITLLRDIEGPGLFIADSSKNVKVTIDFNGYTYTAYATVGSSGTATQAMHFGCNDKATGEEINEVVLMNGKFTTKAGVESMGMAMQNYCKFTARNMVFDLTNIPVTFYGNNYGEYSGHEVSTFNNNRGEQMLLENCTLIFPDSSNYSIAVGSSLKLNNTQIIGSISLFEGEFVLVDATSSVSKGFIKYFDTIVGEITSDTTTNPGYTKYSIK